MKLTFRLIMAFILAFLCYKLSSTSAKEPHGFTQLERALTVQGVIEENYPEYKPLNAEELKAAELEAKFNKHLDKHSKDYLGAVDIPAINTSDSIYKGKDDYYLSHDYKKNSFEPGELYLDDRTGTKLANSGALINGHAMHDGTKFGGFKKLLEIKEQPEVFIWDNKLHKVTTYKMLFVSLIDGANSGIVMKFNNKEEQLQYYKNLYSTSIKKWEEPVAGETFLLLNSCAYIIQDGHYVIVAKKVR